MSERPNLQVVPPADPMDFCEHIPPRFEECSLTTFDPSVSQAAAVALRAAERFAAEDGDIGNMLLSGRPGSGKTHLAAGIARRIGGRLFQTFQDATTALQAKREADAAHPWVPEGHPDREAYLAYMAESPTRWKGVAPSAVTVAERKLDRRCPRWITVPVYLGGLRRAYSSKDADHTVTVSAIERTGLLILDDLGAEKASDWTAATLFEIVAARYENRAPTIVTSNLTVRELNAAGYERIVSRMADEGALIEMASATDYRMRLRKAVS